MFVSNIKILAVAVPEKSFTRLIGENRKKKKKKKKNMYKGNDKQKEADFFLHKITSHTQILC